ncbi:MAG: hypothetical protein L6Q81_05130 [Bacteroidia bacterium]|nr:hypothetical protein [Bacteroidia bacterium]
MKEIKEIFYNLFWQNRACQNLFLLSKEELLDTKTLKYGDDTFYVSFPRIILSNIESKGDFLYEKIKLRTETHTIKSESAINTTIEKYTPIFEAFYDTKLGRSFDKIFQDFQKEGLAPFSDLISSLFSDGQDGFESAAISFLHKYELIGHHIKDMDQLSKYFENDVVQKLLKSVMSEENLWAVLEVVKSFKDRYVSEVYKGLYNSNQVLVSSFHDIDNYEDRLRLFSILYEGGIIRSSSEDSFLECVNCEPAVYRGVLSLKTDPIKLKGFVCPICGQPLTFFVPYELDSTIYNIVKAKDGLLQDALLYKLDSKKIKYSANKLLLEDIEIDCSYELNSKLYVVECKMYKQSNGEARLKTKMKRHFSKLVRDIIRVQKHYKKSSKRIVPILLVNINSTKLLTETLEELKKNNRHHLFQNGRIVTINELPLL